MNDTKHQLLVQLITAFLLLPVSAFFIYLLWNRCLVGLVEGVHPIPTFWHACGVSILANLLFKNR